jgi:peptidoglycan/LPS O-acetylase OafA/YrhL
VATTKSVSLEKEWQASAYRKYLSSQYFTSLDTFRFLAITAVIWHHTQKGVWWFPASNRGFLGVDFFFVISGFLIVTLLLRERDRTGDISLRRFYMRRSLRIFPVYYLMLAVMAVFFLFVKPHSEMARPFFQVLPYQVFYLSNFVTDTTILFFTWSLASEEQFYIFWPPVEKWLRGAVIPVLFGVILINQLINFRVLHGLFGEFNFNLSILQITFTPICLGVLLAHMLHEKRWFVRLFRWIGSPWSSLFWVGAVLLACNLPRPELMGWPRLSIQILMTLLLASCVVVENHWLNSLLQFAIIRRIGVISYGMYLFHEFAAHIVRAFVGSHRTLPPFVMFLVTLALTILVSELSYRYYETPFLHLKDVLNRRGKPRETLEVAANMAR